jgi:hypothetical protein
MAKFTIEVWGDATPKPNMLAEDLRHIACLIEQGYIAGSAAVDEDFDGGGWWSMEGFDLE